MLEFTYQRSKSGALFDTFTVELSHDLLSWISGPDHAEEVGEPLDLGDLINDLVSTRTGEAFNQYAPDLNLRRAMPLFFARYYSSIFKQAGIFAQMGDNWRHNFDWRLTHIDDTIHVVNHRGRTIQFEPDGAAWTLAGKTDVPYQLNENAGPYTLLDPRDQRSHVFDEVGAVIGSYAVTPFGEGLGSCWRTLRLCVNGNYAAGLGQKSELLC